MMKLKEMTTTGAIPAIPAPMQMRRRTFIQPVEVIIRKARLLKRQKQKVSAQFISIADLLS